MTSIHLAVLLEVAIAGPVAMVVLARSLPSWVRGDFGREFGDLLRHGLVRLSAPFAQCEITQRGLRIVEQARRHGQLAGVTAAP